jgi:hypothetical protein
MDRQIDIHHVRYVETVASVAATTILKIVQCLVYTCVAIESG